MAMMVARGSSQLSSSMPVQENVHRNKRKFRADPPLADPSRFMPPEVECPSYGFPVDFNLERHSSMCDLCSGFACPPSADELDVDDFQDADWNNLTETHLKELLLKNLDAIFNSAIKKIVASGYTEEVAAKAVLSSGLCYGSKDPVSNIVDTTLAFLRSGQEANTSREHFFENLQNLERHVLAEMICVLREVRPFFSIGDAMWCLLICDMNVSHACAMDGEALSSLSNDDTALPSSSSQSKPESVPNTSASQSTLELNSPKTHKQSSFTPYSQTAPQSELPSVAGIPNLPPVKLSPSSSSNATTSNSISMKENPLPSADTVISQSHMPAEKLVSGRRCLSGNPKRDAMLRQKSLHFDKSYRAHRSKGSFRAGKLGNLGSLLDKKSKPSSESNIINLKSALVKKNKLLGLDSLQGDESSSISFSAGASSSLAVTSETNSTPSSLPTADTELSLSLPSKSSCNSGNTSNVIPNYNNDVTNYSSYTEISSDKLGRQWVPKDKKDEVLQKLVPRVRELQTQLQEWSEWAQQKVMQAARRLTKDKSELQMLRQEKEEVSRLKKEKQALEENTVKKLSEMEGALSKASCKVDKANAAISRLEIENAALKKQMEAAKVRAAESAATCQEVSRREIKTLKDFQSWDKQKAMLQEELMTEKRTLSQLQQQFDQDKAQLDLLEARWRQEEKVKDEALMQVKCERLERQQNEASAKLKEDAIRLKADHAMQRYKDDMRRLEHQITQLRLTTDFSKIAALRQGINGSYASQLAGGTNPTLKGSSADYVSQMMDLQESGSGDVQRERECVMCLTEEMSVVFLPCAHQVVCATCNELHEKQGMKDCPSCRTPIQHRVAVHSSRS